MAPFLKFRTVLEFSECLNVLLSFSSVLWGDLRLESARLVTGSIISMAGDTEFSPFLWHP